MPRYLILGTTDENTTCDHCGRTDLKSTVVFDVLDPEGITTGDLYYAGSSCATTLPGLHHLSAATIRNRARTAQRVADEKAGAARRRAGEILAKYGPVENARPGLKAAVFFGYNPHCRATGRSATTEVGQMLAQARQVLGDARPAPTKETEELARMTAGFVADFQQRHPEHAH